MLAKKLQRIRRCARPGVELAGRQLPIGGLPYELDTLEGLGVGILGLAEQSSEVGDASESVPRHPVGDPVEDRPEVADVLMSVKGGADLHGRSAGKELLDDAGAVVDPGARGEVAFDLPRENRDPAHGDDALLGIAERFGRHDAELLDVDVESIEAIEEHERVDSPAQLEGGMREAREIGSDS